MQDRQLIGVFDCHSFYGVWYVKAPKQQIYHIYISYTYIYHIYTFIYLKKKLQLSSFGSEINSLMHLLRKFSFSIRFENQNQQTSIYWGPSWFYLYCSSFTIRLGKLRKSYKNVINLPVMIVPEVHTILCIRSHHCNFTQDVRQCHVTRKHSGDGQKSRLIFPDKDILNLYLLCWGAEDLTD